MSVVVDQAALRERLKYVKILNVPLSEFPFRLEKKSTGVLLGMYLSREKAEMALVGMDVTYLASKPTRRKVRR